MSIYRQKSYKRLPKVLTYDEVMKLLKIPNKDAPTGYRNFCMILLMYRAGLRVSEVIGLRTKQIDWRNSQLRVIGKGNKERLIPIEGWVLEALRKWKKIRPKKRAKEFFTTLKGTPVQRRYVNAMLERYSRRANIQHVHPHMLRHTFATDLLNDGFNIREVQQLLGHENLSTTMIYTHVNPVDLRNKIQARRFR